MVNTYKILPGVEKKIAHTLAALDAHPVDPAVTPAAALRVKQRFYMTPAWYRGERVWLKASLQAAPNLRQSLTEEITTHRTLAAFEKTHRLHFSSPSHVSSQLPTRGYGWLLRKYWTGQFAGDMVECFGFRPGFLQQVPPTTMAVILSEVRSMTPAVMRRRRLEQHAHAWYRFDFEYYRRYFLRPLLRHRLNPGWTNRTVARWGAWLDDQESFLRSQATTFTHGDLYPNNIMTVTKPKLRVVLFDWELSHRNLPTFDVTMAYLHAWANPKWQQRFLTAQPWLRAAPNQRSWAISRLSLFIRQAGFAFLRLTNGQPGRYPRLAARHRPTIQRLWQTMVSELQQLDRELK